jgi:hypothetical protein
MARKQTVRLYLDDNRKTFLRVPFSNAKKPVEIPVKLAAAFVDQTRRGVPWECIVAEAIKAHVNGDGFSHKAIPEFAYVVGSAAYVVDRVSKYNGNLPTHVVRYKHNFGGTLRKFDRYSKSKFFNEFGQSEVTIRLSVPRKHGEPGYRGTLGRTGVRNNGGVLRGAHRRAVDAGYAIPGIQKVPEKKREAA